jgi:hypothetical protein
MGREKPTPCTMSRWRERERMCGYARAVSGIPDRRVSWFPVISCPRPALLRRLLHVPPAKHRPHRPRCCSCHPARRPARLLAVAIFLPLIHDASNERTNERTNWTRNPFAWTGGPAANARAPAYSWCPTGRPSKSGVGGLLILWWYRLQERVGRGSDASTKCALATPPA